MVRAADQVRAQRMSLLTAGPSADVLLVATIRDAGVTAQSCVVAGVVGLGWRLRGGGGAGWLGAHVVADAGHDVAEVATERDGR